MPRLRAAPLVLASAVVAVAAAAAVLPLAAQEATPARPKVIVLGFDGLAADRVENLLEAGRLPNLSKLRAKGGYSRLRASNPAQSPVSWASIITGWNPGKTGIYDFLRRKNLDPRTLDIGLATKKEIDPLPTWMRVLLVCAAGLLGTTAAVGVSFAAGVALPAWRRGRPLEISMTAGAAAFALAAFVALKWVPEKVPTAVNLRSGEPFWVTLDRAGVRTVALDAPLCFPPDPMHSGCCLAGLGVPDMTASWGTFSVWSDDPAVPATTETAGSGWFVAPDVTTFDVVIAGPADPLLGDARRSEISAAADREKYRREASLDWNKFQRRESEKKEGLERLGTNLRAILGVTLTRGAGPAGRAGMGSVESATVLLQDGTSVVLTPGAWSDLLPLRFRMSPLKTLSGRVRLLLDDSPAPAAPGRSAAPEEPRRARRPFRLFVGQVQWDLADVPPNVALTAPREFAGELAALGPAETIGWPEQTNPIKDRLLSDRAFIDHTYLLLALRERRLHSQIEKGGFDCLFAMFSEPDRVQHALYRHVDPECPTHDKEAAKLFAGEIDRIYVESDRIVGEVVKAAGEGAIVLVVSDHGFAPFRRGVNLNNFLRSKQWQEGSGEGGQRSVADLTSGGAFFTDVDWDRTKAYGWGLGNINLNLAGREPRGSVSVADEDAVLDGITRDLLALKDADGTKPVRRVYRGKDLYRGARMGEAPDLVVGFEWGYRVSWQSCVGALDHTVIVPNTQPWSGDHCSVDPELVPAILFSSVPLAPGAAPAVEDVAPAVLGLYGVAPNDPDGKSPLAK